MPPRSNHCLVSTGEMPRRTVKISEFLLNEETSQAVQPFLLASHGTVTTASIFVGYLLYDLVDVLRMYPKLGGKHAHAHAELFFVVEFHDIRR